MTYQADGKVVQIQGSVVDVEFPPELLPEIYEAVNVIRPGQNDLVIEVQRHLGGGHARCVAMDTTDGLRRGLTAQRTGAPIKVPVGNATLGRIFNVLGRPVDNKGPVSADL
jgi:F-type H+-transporting ATPase subunit beta